MTFKSPLRRQTRVPDLPSYVPSVPVFDGEESFDAVKEGQAFLERFSSAVRDQDWAAFEDLFDDNCFWKDTLTLTFDQRTLFGKKAVVDAWKETTGARKPVIHTTAKDYGLKLPIGFNRLAPTLASLDVPICFTTQSPGSNCVGVAKLVPHPDGAWRVWLLTTTIRSLTDYPFKTLPRTSPSHVSDSQRGKSKAQGLPKLSDGVVFDAVVAGASSLGVSTTIRLESMDANVIAFDRTNQAGGNWSIEGRAYVTLHQMSHLASLAQYTLPSHYPEDLTGAYLTKYISETVEALKLPVFCGINVVSNTYDETSELWEVCIEDVATGERATVMAKNVVMCLGVVVSGNNLRYPKLANRELFKGPVQHAGVYKDAAPFQDKRVVVVGASNSGHDVARDLVDSGVSDVTILQRGGIAFFEWEKLRPMIEGPYLSTPDIETGDFLFTQMPLGIARAMATGGMAAIEASQGDFYAKLEAKGYAIERNRDFVTKTIETRNGSFFMDRQKTLELVFNDKIKVARGEAVGYTEGGIVVVDTDTKEERELPADGVVLATGFEDVDLVQKWIDTGFLKSKFASDLENPCSLNIDQEGEIPGLITNSGHPHLYVASLSSWANRWISVVVAAQLMADLKGEFPARLSRTAPQ